MIPTEDLPDGWEAATSDTKYDELMGREFETLVFQRRDDQLQLRITEVQDPDDFEGWGFEVIVERPENDAEARGKSLGIVEDVAGARDTALEFMQSHED